MAKSEKKHFFETGLDRLEEISSLLDGEDVSLDDALRLYEEGTRLRAELSKYLAEAERRVAILDAGGNTEIMESGKTQGTSAHDAPETKSAPRKAKSAKKGEDDDEGSLF